MSDSHKTFAVLALGAGLALSACATAASAPPAAPTPVAAAPAAPTPMAAAPAPALVPPAPIATTTAAPADGFDATHAKAAFEETCGSCHEASYATGQRHDRAGWQRLIDTMYGYGMVLPPEGAGEIVEYLTRTYPGAG